MVFDIFPESWQYSLSKYVSIGCEERKRGVAYEKHLNNIFYMKSVCNNEINEIVK